MRNDFLVAVVLRDCLLFELKKKKQVPYCINNRKILTVNNLSAEDYCSEPRQLPIVLRIKLFIQEVSLCSKSKMWRGARGREGGGGGSPGEQGAGEGRKGENRGQEAGSMWGWEAGAEMKKVIVCCLLLGIIQSTTLI